MKAATIHELKEELQKTSAAKLLEINLRLARFKKENKELLTYLLFEENDESAYVQGVKAEINFQFSEIAMDNNLYLIKKSLRKILRHTNKYMRYSGLKTTEIELLLHFCLQLKLSAIPIHKSVALTNLYDMQLKKIKKIIPTFHEDLQHDYEKQLLKLTTQNF